MVKAPPQHRHLARILALQVLYELDLAPSHEPQAALAARFAGEDVEPEPTAEAKRYAEHLLAGVLSHRQEIDQSIQKAAPAWPIAQMPAVDVNILRLAIFEMVFDNRTPLKAAINEAVELAKEYSGENSPRFVNGVLGAIAKGSPPSGRPSA